MFEMIIEVSGNNLIHWNAGHSLVISALIELQEMLDIDVACTYSYNNGNSYTTIYIYI